ncbi:cupin domain-containing protein [Wenzhouxiangella sp. XN79A]|uniref:cupin domain-containing protein n=1 Tax=Wenzhouxiangella sp. XN79A TaxID=2724193 RepID=UPI00144AB35A|nr:cupin domain-containing protein [Wenzhouxiangella sp. XN79A]NKI34498.1 cupin domain-containing protein [Wenzhouxiangella sp. XN79A]
MSQSSTPPIVPILRDTLANDDFRRTVITGAKCQVVLMTLQPGEEIGAEVHDDHDQVLIFAEGRGEAVLDGRAREVGANDLVFVHAGVEHNFINTGDRALKLYTLYAPPEHAEGTRHATRADAAEHDH